MADLELNKLFAAPLVAGVAFMGAGLIGELIVHPHKLERSAIQIGQVAAPAAAPAAAAAPRASSSDRPREVRRFLPPDILRPGIYHI